MNNTIFPGEYEETIGRSWHRSSNLRGFLSKASCPQAIKYCLTVFEALVRPQGSNSLASDSFALPGDAPLDDDYGIYVGLKQAMTPDLRALFKNSPSSSAPQTIPSSAQSFTHVRYGGTVYTVRSRHEGNSGVLFEDTDTPHCIQSILQFPDSSDPTVAQGTWVVAQAHRRAGIDVDPYQQYTHLRMRIWDTELEASKVAMPIAAVKAHFAKLETDWERKRVAVIASLSRVCLIT